jgi:hypothetical protein
MALIAITLIFSCLPAHAGAFGLEGLPGQAPGPAKIECHGPTISVGNRLLKATWVTTDEGIKLVSVAALGQNQSLSVTGELFEVTFADGRRYAASALAPQGKPRVSRLRPESKAARLAARCGGWQVDLPLRSADGQFGVMWRLLALDNANYFRQEIEVAAGDATRAVKEMGWLAQPIPGSEVAGQVDGSPVVAGSFFYGLEDPHAQLGCRLHRDAPLSRGERQSFVLGVAPPGQMRRAFLYYLERERAHPYRSFLHYNSWYDIAWEPFALNETNCLEAIELLGQRFLKPYHVKMDAIVFDDGWDNPETLWRFHRGFPGGFTPLARRCAQYHTRLGVWLSPFGGYGQPKEQRLRFGSKQGYETNAAGFSLAGPRYYAAFKDACVGMIRNYGVNHFKFDGIAAGMFASGGADYFRDTQAMRRLMLELRQEDPGLYINLTTGSWPSPFWLRFADSLWHQGGDMGLAGKGSHQQQWLTYRDQETYRNIVRKGRLFPLNSLMTQGVAYSRQGTAGDPTFNAAGFKDDVRAFFGSGTGLQELYIQPARLSPEDWRVLAEAAKWSRANADVLVDTHWLGGDPSKLEVYGYASWRPRKGIVMLRNPDDRPQEFLMDLAAAFELPPGARTGFKLKSAWTEDAHKPVIPVAPGSGARIKLQPFEVAVLEAAPIE